MAFSHGSDSCPASVGCLPFKAVTTLSLLFTRGGHSKETVSLDGYSGGQGPGMFPHVTATPGTPRNREKDFLALECLPLSFSLLKNDALYYYLEGKFTRGETQKDLYGSPLQVHMGEGAQGFRLPFDAAFPGSQAMERWGWLQLLLPW